jgi:hypothetical protein
MTRQKSKSKIKKVGDKNNKRKERNVLHKQTSNSFVRVYKLFPPTGERKEKVGVSC